MIYTNSRESTLMKSPLFHSSIRRTYSSPPDFIGDAILPVDYSIEELSILPLKDSVTVDMTGSGEPERKKKKRSRLSLRRWSGYHAEEDGSGSDLMKKLILGAIFIFFVGLIIFTQLEETRKSNETNLNKKLTQQANNLFKDNEKLFKRLYTNYLKNP